MQEIFTFKKNENISGWKKLSKAGYNSFLHFIAPYEHFCVPMTSRISLAGKPSAGELKNAEIFIYYSNSQALAAVFAGNDSIIVPLFPEGTIPESGQLTNVLQGSKNIRKKYLTLMGELSSVRLLTQLFTGRNSHSVDYKLLTADSALIAALPQLRNRELPLQDIIIKTAVSSDIDLLMPLRKDYEIEEVLLDPSTFNETACRIRFLDTIKTKTVLYGIYQNRPVATCCVNASGLNWNQLGGVFTMPEYRSLGVSSAVLRKIAEFSAMKKKNLTLFVKPSNTPAVRLYEKNGFILRNDYRISYLERR